MLPQRKQQGSLGQFCLVWPHPPHCVHELLSTDLPLVQLARGVRERGKDGLAKAVDRVAMASMSRAESATCEVVEVLFVDESVLGGITFPDILDMVGADCMVEVALG